MKASRVFWILLGLALVAVLISRFRPEWLPDPVAKRLPGSHGEAPPLYKWRDAKGHLNVTSTPPADRPYEIVRYDPRTNVVPGGSTPR